MSALSPIEDRHNLATEKADQTPVVMKEPVQQVPQQTPPAKPTVFKPTGPPIPALTHIGYWGSINDFNAAVQAAHDSYVIQNGVRPDPKTLLHTALQTPVTAGRRDQGPEQLSRLPPIGQEDNAALLKQLTDIPKKVTDYSSHQAAKQEYDDFMHVHSDVLQGMLNDPSTHAKTLAAINNADASLHFLGVNGPEANESFGHAMKGLGLAGVTTANYVGQAAFALTQDFFQMGGTSAMYDPKHPDKKVLNSEAIRAEAVNLPHLTKIAPAVAQVVKGLAYSPAGVGQAAWAMSKDLYEANLFRLSGGKQGSIGFDNTRRLAKAVGMSFYNDLNDPSGRAGYLLLDAFGMISLGVGTAARLGRGAEAFGEAEATTTTGRDLPPVDELLFHGTRKDIASETAARGSLQPRNHTSGLTGHTYGKPIWFSEDSRYAAGHSGDKRLPTSQERVASQKDSSVFVVERSALRDPEFLEGNGATTHHEVSIVGHVPSEVAFQGNDAVHRYLQEHPENLSGDFRTTVTKPGTKAKLKAGVKAALQPHDLHTVEYNKNGYVEHVSLSGNTFTAMIQRRMPVFGTDAQVRQLADPLHDPTAWLAETKIGDDFTYHHGKFASALGEVIDTLNPISPEMRMGRAGSIRRATETKGLSAPAQVIEDTAGAASRSSWLEPFLPKNWPGGLTRGEVKALQAASWDVPGGLSAQIAAEERTHQFLIESGMGDKSAHQRQIALLGLAREAIKNPSARFQQVLDAMQEATSKVEQIRVAYGMPFETAEARVMEPGVFMDLASQAHETMRQIEGAMRVQTLKEGEEVVYHGSAAPFKKYDEGKSVTSNDLGRGVWVSPEARYASQYAGAHSFLRDYAQGGLVREQAMRDIPMENLIGPRVNIHRIDTSKLLDLRESDPARIAALKQKIEAKLTPGQKIALQKMDDEMTSATKWADVTTGREIHDALAMLARHLMEDGELPEKNARASAAWFADSHDWANGLLKKIGFNGLIRRDGLSNMTTEYMLFNSKDLHGAYGEPPGMKEMEQKLHDLKSSMASLDVRWVPEEYAPPEFKPSKGLAKEQDKLEKMRAEEARHHERERKLRDEQRRKIALGTGREFSLDNKVREDIVNVGERISKQEKDVAAKLKAETKEHERRNPRGPVIGKGPGNEEIRGSLQEGFYVRVGDEWVKVNRQTTDSFYLPILLRGKAVPLTKGNVRLPGSMFGIGKNSVSVWEKNQMTGKALVDGDFRVDAQNLAGQSYAQTARAIVRFNAWNQVWDHARELKGDERDLRKHEIYVRDVSDVPDNVRKSLASFYEGKITQDQIDSLPDDLNKYLFPENPEPGDHVRAIDSRILGDLFFNEPSRAFAQMEPGIRAFTSPINNSLRTFILYGPKYSLNILGNDAMLIFDQGFVRAHANLARAMGMRDWALEDDYIVAKKLMGAGKASSYMSGEARTPFSTASQGLADFWSRISDQDFRLASFIYYADRMGFKTPEEIHDLLTNETHEVVRNDVVKRGNDALVAFDRMSPIEKALFRHFLFVYPWQRGALIWTFRAIFEHPAKTALLATLGQEAYTDDKWMKEVPAWVRRTGYVPWHSTGDKVHVINPTSINTPSILNDVVSTAKGLLEGDPYARASDLFGPAGQFISHSITGVDSFGNPYKGSQLLGAVEDTLNMVPLMSAYRRAQKGDGKALAQYNIADQAGLAATLSSALKMSSLTPGWLGGWGGALAGGFSARELNLSALAARYWTATSPEKRHQHEVDLTMRQLSIQSMFLSTGKVPSNDEVMRMMLAPLGSILVKGTVPEGVRQAVLDAGQISYQAAVKAKALGRTLTEKEKLLLSIDYYHQAGRIDKSETNSLTAEANGYDDVPDIRHMAAKVSMKYGNAKALYEWDRRVRLQVSFTNADTGQANVAQRFGILYANGLSKQGSFNLNDEERAQYGHLYTKYVTARDAFREKLRSDTTLTPTQKSYRLVEFDSDYNKPVKIGSRTLPSLLALGSGSNWDMGSTDTESSQKRMRLIVAKNWGHLNTAEKSMFGKTVSPDAAKGWAKYWDVIKYYREKGYTIDGPTKQFAAAYVQRYFAKGFMQDWLYATNTPKIDRFTQSKMYATMPDKETFDTIASYAKSYAKGMADGTSTIEGTRHAWKAYVNDSLMPWLKKEHPDLYAWVEPLGASWLTSMINTG